MKQKNQNKLEFKIKRQTIQTTEIIQQISDFYTIYKTNSEKFFIKTFDNQNLEKNQELSSQELKIQNQILTNGIKIVDQKKIDNKIIFLIESYFCCLYTGDTFQINTLYEFKKMLKHIFVQIKILVQKQKFIFLDLNSVVLNKSFNFELFNLQTDPYDVKGNLTYQPPEMRFLHQFNLFSVVWNIGIMLLQLRLGKKRLNINYDSGKIDFEVDQKKLKLNKRDDQYILDIIKKCLQFEPQDRITYNDLQKLVLKQQIYYDIFFNNSYKNVQKFQQFFENLGNLKCRDILIVQDLKSQSNKTKKQRLTKMIDNLLSPKNEFNLQYVLEITTLCIKDNKNYKTVLQKTLKKIQSIRVQSKFVYIFKSLLFLQPFIYMNPNAILQTFPKNEQKESFVDKILNLIITKVEQKNDLLLMYGLILQEKCNFVFRCQKFMDNNFGMSKKNFVNYWDKICKIRYIKDLLNILQLNIGFLLLIKTSTDNHFLQKLQDFTMQEINSIIKLATNVICLLYYIDCFYWSKDLYDIIKEIILVLENDRLIMNCFLIEHFKDEKRKNSLLIPQNIEQQFQVFQEKLQKYKKLNFQSFIQNYYNFIVQMLDGVQQDQSDNIYFELQEDLLFQQQLDWYRYKDQRDLLKIDNYKIIFEKWRLNEKIEVFALKNQLYEKRKKTEDSIYYSKNQSSIQHVLDKEKQQKDEKIQIQEVKKTDDLQTQIDVEKQGEIKIEQEIEKNNFYLLSEQKQKSVQKNILSPEKQKTKQSQVQIEQQIQKLSYIENDTQYTQKNVNEYNNQSRDNNSKFDASNLSNTKDKNEYQNIEQIQEKTISNTQNQYNTKSNISKYSKKQTEKYIIQNKDNMSMTESSIKDSRIQEYKSYQKIKNTKSFDMRISESRVEDPKNKSKIEVIGTYFKTQTKSQITSNILQQPYQKKQIKTQDKSTQTIFQQQQIQQDQNITQQNQNQQIDSVKDLDIGQLMLKFVESQIQLSAISQVIDYYELEFIKLIHDGSSSQIFEGQYRYLNIAIKRLKAPETDDDYKFLKEFQNELQIQIQIAHHPNLINMIGVCYHFQNFFVITEFCRGGNLYDVMFEINLSMQFKKCLKSKDQFRSCQSYILFTQLK